jgi:hypothetical protein
MTKIFANVAPGDLITSDLFNQMIAKIEELDDRVAAIERTATGTIAGSVKEIAKSMPIIGARIYAVSGNVTYSSTPTDNLGNYSITNLLPGIYRVWAESEDFSRSNIETISVSSASTSTVNFVLTSSVNMVEVPDVQGVALSQALETIRSSGLTAGFLMDVDSNIIDSTDSSSSSLIVINQSLSPGEPVPVGTVINLFMAVNATESLPPIILDIKPNVDVPKAEVEIIGVGFGSKKNKVTFSKVEATEITAWTGDSVRVKVPEGAVTGTVDVQIITIDGLKSNTFNFTVKREECTSGCTTSCTASCTIGCTSGCTSSCTASCTVACTSACIFSCTTARIAACLRDISVCSKELILKNISIPTSSSRIVNLQQNQGNFYEDAGETLVNNTDIAIKKSDTVMIGDKDNRVEGTIKKADVRIEGKEGEISKAIITSGTRNVEIKTQSGDEIKGNAISSAAIGVAPKATVISIKDSKGKAWGGTIVTTEGQYETSIGITIEPGKEATIQVGDKLITGKVTEKVVISTKDIDLGNVGINRLSP